MKVKPIGLIGLFSFLATPALAAQQDRCQEASFDQALYGLCKAYTSGVDCLAPENRDAQRCVRLRQNLARKGGGDLDERLTGTKGVKGTIAPDGGTIELPDVAKVWFPAGAFDSPRTVALKTTSDDDVNALFDETASSFRTAGRLPYELRIGTGDAPPLSETVQVSMHVPDSLLASMPADHAIEAFVGIEQGGAQEIPHTLFELIESEYDATNQVITLEIPGAAFASNALTQGEYQAIITLAPTPGGERFDRLNLTPFSPGR